LIVGKNLAKKYTAGSISVPKKLRSGLGTSVDRLLDAAVPRLYVVILPIVSGSAEP
jgi:hypothetical protein